MYKKMGIITFHHASSYGAVLQSYALQNFLTEIGIENTIVNYRCKFIEDRAKVFTYIKGKSLKNYGYSFFYGKEIVRERKNAEYFGKHFLKMTKAYTKTSLPQCADDFDGFIAGSDQIWSPSCVGFDSSYFLDFAKSNQKYSYAASFGTKELPEEKISAYKCYLSDFEMISVREESGSELVEKLTGRKAEVYIDPTLLLSADKWDQLVLDNERKEPYIFLFTVNKPKNLVKYALELARKTGMRVIYLNKSRKIKDSMLTYMDCVTADKFVGLIKNAAYVCTNSFHGNAFSIIYHKKFVVETETLSGENNRSKEFMTRLGLENRVLAQGMEPDINADTDWTAIDGFLEKERKKSREFFISIAKL